MYVEHIKSRQGQKVYTQILLRESYRDPNATGNQVKHRTLMNLTKQRPEDVEAIEFALKHKGDLDKLKAVAKEEIKLKQGKSVGAVWLLFQVAKRLGLVEVLGRSQEGRRTLWQVFARLIEQGSRLSAVRLAQEHAACEILGIKSFSEDDLYSDLDWLDARQAKIEDKLFNKNYSGDEVPELFLYDVTSSYFEGTENEYAAYGYNRDGKRGKKQIVVGLMTDPSGRPVTVEIFKGNTRDPNTVASQIRKLAARFNVKGVTLVGDRGMIKSAQMDDLNDVSFHYLTAITKPQIESLIKQGVLQLDLFDEKVFEVRTEDGQRLILRRNPIRASELAENKKDKYRALEQKVMDKNDYLNSHPKAKIDVALRDLKEMAKKLRIQKWVTIEGDTNKITISINDDELEKASRLDGCYVLKTDVFTEKITPEQLHDRYKDLAKVESAFCNMKTGHLEIRPIYVRTAAHTRAHVFIVMMAYMIRRELDKTWRNLDLKVQEGLNRLTTLCATEVAFGDGAGCLTVPAPRESLAELFAACDINPPNALPKSTAKAATKTKLPKHRINH